MQGGLCTKHNRGTKGTRKVQHTCTRGQFTEEWQSSAPVACLQSSAASHVFLCTEGVQQHTLVHWVVCQAARADACMVFPAEGGL